MKETPKVMLETSFGNIKLELFEKDAPETVANFLVYVDEGHYDNTIFHRVIPGFMIQGGGMTPGMQEKPAHDPIRNEAKDAGANNRGTIAMARTMIVDSATCQFFINTVDNDFLNYQNSTPQGFGYCVFGHVIEGMDVVDRIEKVPTGNRNGHQDVPVEPVIILKAYRA
ncbi:MAG: peptidyl-prolyl cis-trans isomerase [Lentisphaeria bacterium]|nr:peptidyl-prolyl cis-trans isomerase [Lentisphaeria bacterium]